MLTMKVATFVSHEPACPGMSWLSGFCAFWFKCSLTVFIPGHTTPPETVFVAFAQLLTQVAEDWGIEEAELWDSGLKESLWDSSLQRH
jgi:hypothetical protein